MNVKKIHIEPQRFSEHFDLKIKSEDLEFLDIYVNQDIQLFLDPYGISAMKTEWSKTCELHITGFFQLLVDSINTGDKKGIRIILNALHEVDEVALGYSSNAPSGRGIGQTQATEIEGAFETSDAAKSGDIKDIADCALMIPGINRDKISDITSNILKRPLIIFTKEQCKKYGVPTQRVPINNAFDYETLSFSSFFTNLPVINGRPKILLPIRAVRRDPQLSKDKYYRNFVLEFLRAEHEHAGDALATILKNGRIVVRKKDLENKFPMSADYLYKFSKEHPSVLEKYKNQLRNTLSNENIQPLQPNRKILSLKDRLEIIESIKPGKIEADRFHKIIFDSLIVILGERINNPKVEVQINDGRKRIDITFNNTDLKGFFYRVNSLHHIKCPKIFVECKNYKEEISNPEFDQLQGRMSDKRGRFGFLICRNIENRKKIIQKSKDLMNDKGDYIIVLDDIDIKTLLNFKENKQESEIDNYLSQKMDELIM